MARTDSSLLNQKIVQEEQESNFISRLHAGQLNIIPWPVIESKQFYTLFPAIKIQLDKQKFTHGNAGNFLRTMKTLMAKLKVSINELSLFLPQIQKLIFGQTNDWRALSRKIIQNNIGFVRLTV